MHWIIAIVLVYALILPFVLLLCVAAKRGDKTREFAFADYTRKTHQNA